MGLFKKSSLENKLVSLSDGRIVLIQRDDNRKLFGLTVSKNPVSISIFRKEVTILDTELTQEEYDQLLLNYKYKISKDAAETCWNRLQNDRGAESIKAYNLAIKKQKELYKELLTHRLREDRFELNV